MKLALALTFLLLLGVSPGSAQVPGNALNFPYIRTNTITSTSYTILVSDQLNLVNLTASAPISVTLPQYGNGFAFYLTVSGSSNATITPLIGNINNNPTLTVSSGNWCLIVSDGSNWRAFCNLNVALGQGIYTYSTLPSCNSSVSSTRTFISDSVASPTFAAAASGGGTLFIPVYCDGVSWRNG